MWIYKDDIWMQIKFRIKLVLDRNGVGLKEYY